MSNLTPSRPSSVNKPLKTFYVKANNLMKLLNAICLFSLLSLIMTFALINSKLQYLYSIITPLLDFSLGNLEWIQKFSFKQFSNYRSRKNWWWGSRLNEWNIICLSSRTKTKKNRLSLDKLVFLFSNPQWLNSYNRTFQLIKKSKDLTQ